MNTKLIDHKVQNAKKTKVSKPNSKVKRIKNSDTAYEQGGVFEASKFAKGDGWK